MSHWTTERYHQHAAFVPALTADVVALLGPVDGLRVLDLGCGEGTLTETLVARGARVVGVDSAPDFVATARARGLDVRLMDAEALPFDREFEVVFSNAALHWMRDADAVIRGVARALRPGGRFVGEFGGHGNVAAIQVAITAVLARRGLDVATPWFYPTDAEYRLKLEAHGFQVEQIGLFPRPTPLPTGMRGWIDMFGRPRLGRVPDEDRENVAREIEDLLRPALCDASGQWTADYVRLRFAAHLA